MQDEGEEDGERERERERETRRDAALTIFSTTVKDSPPLTTRQGSVRFIGI